MDELINIKGYNATPLPKDNPELVRRLSLRWLRAAEPHRKWAEPAKVCVDFLEGLQWSEEDKALLDGIGRQALTINKMAPLFRMVMGYQSSNRNDVTFLPTSDSQSQEDVARVLTALHKIEADRDDLVWTDTDVFADGIATGRGFWGCYTCFEDNDLGQIKWINKDNFSVFIDPDANTYDLNKSAAYIQDSVWTDLDYIGATYGKVAEDAVRNVYAGNYQSSLLYYLGQDEISPERFFGQYRDDKADTTWNDIYYNDFVDKQAKRIRLLDTEYYVNTIQPCFIDLETGGKKPIPTEWMKPENQYMIQQCLDYAMMKNNPIKIAQRPVKRIRRTVTCGDILLFDDWSLYESYSTIGYFPYFRKGKTRGMLNDMIDPQKELNKKRSFITDILNRNANSGWIYEENSLDPEQEENLKQYGSSPGIHVKYKRGPQGSEAPRRLEAGGYPQGLDRLEEKAGDDLREISGINESALGQLDRVQSGRAIEARQRQAVISIQMYSDNFTRSKKILGRKSLEIFQNFYTEERVYRDIGEDSKMVVYEINKKIQTGDNSMKRLNDITLGKYGVKVDEVPISATFKQGQFEETMSILEKLGPLGMALLQVNPSLVIDQSSLSNKEDWKAALQQAQQAALPPPAAAGAPPAGAPATNGTPEGMPS